ncbi:MAG: M28 family peptidase [Bacteroidales bacterium]|nr:M28 family peptidase [Bacteroidales bacterium]
MKIIAALAASFLLSPAAVAGIREDLGHLADPLLEGRGHAARGAAEASFYLTRRFQQCGYDVRYQCFTTQKGLGRNVYAVCKGNPKSDQYVLVCAHYDGIGVIDCTVYPGADANASGVAVLLYLAEELKDCGGNFIFAALDGYSEKLAGAEAFAGLPYKLSMAVNIDTVGSTLAPPNKYRPDFLIALGGKPYEKQLEAANSGPRLRLYYDYYRSKGFTDYFYSRISDQAPFLRKGIPAVMFTSGITMNTNKVDDTPATLDYEVLQRRAELIRCWLVSRN